MSTIYPGPSTAETRAANSYVAFQRSAPLSNEQLNAVRAEAKRLGRPLTSEESAIIMGLSPEQKSGGVRTIEVDVQ